MLMSLLNCRLGRIVCLTMLLAGCGPSEQSHYQPELAQMPVQAVTEYVVGIHPLHNPQRLMERYGPIVDYLNSRIPDAHFKLEASRNYEEFEKKTVCRTVCFCHAQPLSDH